ncbi:hypothetical protein [Enterococcus saccharolyticus]|uniref:Uncharacterized protein n=1 Tax=Enterococcus saccharolyticus 30_1 TaxID=742813 RepID=A0AA87FJ65_9ENTE|nr:hypothetical protein [Enterococcus saccharolyticus]EHG30650.1 hypothetical protein HMPREF9478_00535 [Enterococcus saccharolyticus 30_1]
MEKVNSSSRLWSKDFYLVMVVTVLAMTAITTQMGTMPLYVASLGGSKAVSGAIVGVLGYLLCFAVCQSVWHWIDMDAKSCFVWD